MEIEHLACDLRLAIDRLLCSLSAKEGGLALCQGAEICRKSQPLTRVWLEAWRDSPTGSEEGTGAARALGTEADGLGRPQGAKMKLNVQ